MRSVFPILSVVAALLLFWYAAAFSLNSNWAYNKAERAGVILSFSELVSDTWSQEKPRLPAPHQVCLLYTSPSPRDRTRSRMPSSA